MFRKKNDDNLFLNDIGSLSQIYDNKKRFINSFNPNYKKRNPPKGGPKPKNVRNFEKYPPREFNKKDEKSFPSHSKFRAPENLPKETPKNLYDDDDVQVVSHVKTKEVSFLDDRLYDEFELNAQQPKSPQKKDPLKNDAPWRMNRESKRAQDVERLLEFERTFKNDEIIGDNRMQETSPKPQEYEKMSQSNEKSMRKRVEFDENYTEWAYDDVYDDEEKYEKDTPYDPAEFSYDDHPEESFSREGFSNPENPSDELLDENYPNAGIPFHIDQYEEKLKKDDAPLFRLFTSKEAAASRNEFLNRIANMEKESDEDVIILDDSISKKPIRLNEVKNKIKISFNHEAKIKPINDSIFTEDSNSPSIREQSHSGQKIPVLSRPEGSNSSMNSSAPSTPLKSATSATAVAPVAPVAPVNQIQYPPTLGNMQMPPNRFTNPNYPVMGQNFLNSYNPFGGPVMNEPPSSNNFPRGNSGPLGFSSTQPLAQFNFAEALRPSVGWPSSSGNLPSTETNTATEQPSNQEKTKNEDAVKDEIRRQNKNLMEQRDQYYQKYDSLKEELNKLKKQKKMLLDKKSHQAENFLKENNKFQNEIQNKIKAVKNVIDMFSKIIDKENSRKSASDSGDESKQSSNERDEKSKKAKRRYSRSRSKSRHRSRSRSRSRKSRTRSRSRSRTRSRSHSRSRHRSRSRSHSPKRSRRRSRSRDKYYRRWRSPSKEKKPKKRDKEEKREEIKSVTNPDLLMDKIEREQEKMEGLKPQFDRFKSSFEEIVNEPAKDVLKPPGMNVKPLRRFEKSANLVPNTIQILPKTLESRNLQTDLGRNERINYVHYDPEIHWCRVCNVFPKTAKEYLLHLHMSEHKQVLAKNNLIDYPWHKNQPESKKPVYPDAPTERVPIRGLPFFVSASAWFCKLCNEWMGDLHCASAHLKSDSHEANYAIFLKSNPDWEEHWLDSRNKAQDVINQLKAAESITPAYSSETYVKPTPILPTVLPLPPREKKRTQRVNSSSPSIGSSDEEKTRKQNLKNERKRTPEKKLKITLTDPKKVKDFAKRPKLEVQEKFESITKPVEDKFVDEWMKPVRSKSKEREFLELKNKLKRKEAIERNRLIEARKRNMNIRMHGGIDGFRRSPERSRDDKRSEDKRSDLKKDDKRRAPNSQKPSEKLIPEGPKLPEKFERIVIESKLLENKSEYGEDSRKFSDKPPVRGRFPFIGKMPSKLTKKFESDSKPSKIKIKGASTTVKDQKSDNDLPVLAQKQIEKYDKVADEGEEGDDADMVVVDMDINEDEDEPVSIVIDDNISRKKDFEETLKLLYPEDQPKVPTDYSSLIQASGMPAQNITQDYLVSLIKSTLVEKFKMPELESQNAQILEMASSMKQALTSIPMLADIPFPMNDPLNPPAHIAKEEQLYHRAEFDKEKCESDEQGEDLAPPGTADIDLAPKKKKNPISQKKRRHLRKLRNQLAEKEKLLQDKIDEQKSLGEEVPEEVCEPQSPLRPITSFDSDLLMLGIDEEDSAALHF